MENQGVFRRDTSLALSLRMRKRNELLFFVSKQTTHVSANEYRLNRQTCPGIQSVPTLILTIDISDRLYIF